MSDKVLTTFTSDFIWPPDTQTHHFRAGGTLALEPKIAATARASGAGQDPEPGASAATEVKPARTRPSRTHTRPKAKG